MRLVFMGTPSFAVPTLAALHEAGHEVALVVTQPDKPKGRGMKLAPPPVKEKALELGLVVFQPERVKAPEAVEALANIAPDAIVVAAFGQILPKTVLDIPKSGCYNVHASLLPKYRGAAPINWAIINGEESTGVTIMKMDVGMDTGEMLLKEEEPILPDDTAGTLTERLAAMGARLMVKALKELEAGVLHGTPQDSGKATYASMLKKEMGRIDWTRPAVEIERLVRGLNPWPGAYTVVKGETLKIWKAAVKGEDESPATSGEVIDAGKDGILVACGPGALLIQELQPAGGRRMKASEYLAGHPIRPSERLG